jgi:hypothetical protein
MTKHTYAETRSEAGQDWMIREFDVVDCWGLGEALKKTTEHWQACGYMVRWVWAEAF